MNLHVTIEWKDYRFQFDDSISFEAFSSYFNKSKQLYNEYLFNICNVLMDYSEVIIVTYGN